VFGGTAFAAYFSGVLLSLFGWAGIAATVFPAAALGALLILASRRAAGVGSRPPEPRRIAL